MSVNKMGLDRCKPEDDDRGGAGNQRGDECLDQQIVVHRRTLQTPMWNEEAQPKATRLFPGWYKMHSLIGCFIFRCHTKGWSCWHRYDTALEGEKLSGVFTHECLSLALRCRFGSLRQRQLVGVSRAFAEMSAFPRFSTALRGKAVIRNACQKGRV